MADVNQLHGSCACERNQYTIVVPPSSASLAQVFFDNSALSRRAQASPVTAWLRIPLDWYHSFTIAHFPDESHGSIRRTFYTPTSPSSLPPTRKTFCGFCGSHLTQWNEALHSPADRTRDAGSLDITLGSLLRESLDKLEALNILPDADSDDAPSPAGMAGLVKGGSIDEEDHIPTTEAEGVGADALSTSRTVSGPPHLMRGRGMPFFEEMIDHSRLGRIRRQVGGHTSRDGTTTVQWEVVEINGSPEPEPEPDTAMTDPDGSGHDKKRQKLEK